MNKRNTIELIIGVLFIIFSVFVFNKPVLAFNVISYLLGISCCAKAIHLMYLYIKIKDTFVFKANTFIVLAIILFTLGAIFIFKTEFTKNVFAYILAVWFIYDAVNNFLSLGIVKSLNFGLYILTIISNIILVIGGVCLIINPWVAAISLSFVLGVTFLVSGLEYIIFSISGRKDSGITFRNLH